MSAPQNSQQAPQSVGPNVPAPAANPQNPAPAGPAAQQAPQQGQQANQQAPAPAQQRHKPCGCARQPCQRHGFAQAPAAPRIGPWKMSDTQVKYLYDIGVVTYDQWKQYSEGTQGDPHSHPVAACIRNYAEKLMHTYIGGIGQPGVVVDVGGNVERNQNRPLVWTTAPELIAKDSVGNGVRDIQGLARWCKCKFDPTRPTACCAAFTTWLNGRAVKAFVMVDVIYYLSKEEVLSMCKVTPLVLSYAHIFDGAIGQKCLGEISYERSAGGKITMSVTDGGLASYTHDACDWLRQRATLVGDEAMAWEPKYTIGRPGDQTIIHRFAVTRPELVISQNVANSTDPFCRNLFAPVDFSGRPTALKKMDPTWMDVSKDPIYSAGNHFIVNHNDKSMIAPKEVVARVAFHIAGLPRDEKTWQTALSQAKQQYRTLNIPITDAAQAASVTVAAALGYLHGFTLDEAVLEHIIGSSYDLERKQIHAEKTAAFRPITWYDKAKIFFHEWMKPKLPMIAGAIGVAALGYYMGRPKPQTPTIQVSMDSYSSWYTPSDSFVSDDIGETAAIGLGSLFTGMLRVAYPNAPGGAIGSMCTLLLSRRLSNLGLNEKMIAVVAGAALDAASVPNTGVLGTLAYYATPYACLWLLNSPSRYNPWNKVKQLTLSTVSLISTASTIGRVLMWTGIACATAIAGYQLYDYATKPRAVTDSSGKDIVLYNDCMEGTEFEPLASNKDVIMNYPLDFPPCKPSIVAIAGGPVHSARQPYYPRKCIHNEMLSLHNRHLKRTPTPEPEAWEKMIQKLYKRESWMISCSLVGRWVEGAEMGVSEWLARFPPARRAILQKAYEDPSPVTLSIEFHGKAEKLEKPTVQRGISATNPKYQVATGPATLYASNLLKQYTRHGPVAYTSGWQVEDLSEWYTAHAENGRAFVPADASKFDAHVGPDAIKYEMAVYRRMGMPPAYIRLLSMQRKLIGWTSFRIFFSVRTIRASGVGNTSCGNSILSIAMGSEAIDRTQKHCNAKATSYDDIEGVVLGDDNLYAVAPPLVPLFSDFLTKVYTECGFKLTISSGRPDYCSGFFWKHGAGFRFGPKIGRTILKAFWLEMHERTTDRCALAALSLLYSASFLPVLRVMAKVVLDYHGTPEGGLKDHHLYQRNLAECTPETMDDVCEHYAVSRLEVEAIEDWIVANGPYCDFNAAPLQIRLNVERMIEIDCPDWAPKTHQ